MAGAQGGWIAQGVTGWRAASARGPTLWNWSAAAPALSRMLAQEEAERRPALWLPVFLLAGALAYFAADREPGLAPPSLAMLAAAVASWIAGRRGWIASARLGLAAAFFFGGLTAGVLRTMLVAAPVLGGVKVAKVTAFVETVDDRIGGGGRLLLRVGAIDGVAPGATPTRLRVTVRTLGDLRAGDVIQATMRLVPPAEPSEPGGYDFAREAFFQGIGAVGSVISRVEPATRFDVPLIARINAAIDRARNDLTHRIAGVIGGDDGAVAAALITGKRGLISDQANDVLRGAGIYHVVSISGLHMVLAAGLFMWTLRALLALSPSIALTWPVKKISAAFAMLGALAYDIFAGSEVATERSLVMIVVMLGAVLLDRPVLSMRNLAVAALLVMLREPESVMGPSFQMSFAAVAAMIALFERGPGEGGGERASSVPARILRTLWVMLLTTAVAGLATGAYASFHFHRINPYSLIGNSLTMPFVEFLVMPLAVAGVLANPFGLDAPIWTLMGYGITGMMEVSRHVAALEGSTRYVEAFGCGALLVISLGVLWLTLWRSPIRWAGALLAGAGLWLAQAWSPPDLAIDGGARSIAARGVSGRFDVLNGKGNDFAVSQWLLGDADARRPAPDLIGDGRCDATGCVTRLVDGRTLAFVLAPAALPEDCARADILVTRLRTFGRCAGPELVLDGAHFETHGATELRLASDGSFTLRTARREGQDRPWLPRHGVRLTRAPARGEPQDEPAQPGVTDADPAAFLPD